VYFAVYKVFHIPSVFGSLLFIHFESEEFGNDSIIVWYSICLLTTELKYWYLTFHLQFLNIKLRPFLLIHELLSYFKKRTIISFHWVISVFESNEQTVFTMFVCKYTTSLCKVVFILHCDVLSFLNVMVSKEVLLLL